MNNQLLTGKLVRLTAQNTDRDAKPLAEWSRDTEYLRLMEVHPVRPQNADHFKRHMEYDTNPRFYPFSIRVLENDEFIGDIMLMYVNHFHRDCYVGIGIGNRAYWGKGYGSDAMNVILRFAFMELNLHRVSLDTLGKNTRAIRSYEKCGFVIEGQRRRAEQRGTRDDIVAMGVLRSEWLEKNNA